MIPKSFKVSISDELIKQRSEGRYSYLRPMRYWVSFLFIMGLFNGIGFVNFTTAITSFSGIIALDPKNLITYVAMIIWIFLLYIFFLTVIAGAHIYDVILDVVEKYCK